MCPAGAQDRVTAAVPVPPNLAYPVGSEITFQWTYSCHNNQHCVFGCGGSQNGVTDLTIYLGTVPVGNNQKAPALFYYYSTPTIQRNNGFRIVSGRAARLAAIPAGESPANRRSPVAVVVISSNGEGDRSVESLEVKVPEGWAFQSDPYRGASNLAGCSGSEPVKPRNLPPA